MNEMIMVCHSLNNNTLTGFVISLYLNTNPLISLIPPNFRIASNFRHLLSCGTIIGINLFKKKRSCFLIKEVIIE